MSLEHAILGFLNYTPFSGYDLKKMFDTSVQHFWAADQSQIYRTLARLVERGWTEVEVVEQDDRPDRKVYHLTEAGRTELHRWLITPLTHGPHRSPELVQVFFAGQLQDAEILEMFEREAEKIRAVLARFGDVPQQAAEYVETLGTPRETFFWFLTLEAGIESARAHLAWLESVITRIQAGAVPPFEPGTTESKESHD